MKAILEFTLPEEQTGYTEAVNGWKYLAAIQDALNHLKLLDDSNHDGAERDRLVLISCCNDRGFDPWGD